MSTSAITNNTSSQPLERKKVPAPVLDTPENSIEEKRVGWFDQDEFRGFDATTGSIDFNPEINPDTKVPDGVKSSLFNPGEWTSIIPNSVNVVSKTVDVAKSVVSETKDAGLDLLNQITGKTEEKTEVPQTFQKAFEDEDPSKLDPTVARKQEEAKEYSVIKDAEETLAKAQADYRGEEMLEKAIMSKRSEIADLANLQGNYRDVLDEKGEVRTDLQASVAQKRKEILEAQQADKSPVVSTSKKGGQGLEIKNVNKANETSGGNTNATNAVG